MFTATWDFSWWRVNEPPPTLQWQRYHDHGNGPAESASLRKSLEVQNGKALRVKQAAAAEIKAQAHARAKAAAQAQLNAEALAKAQLADGSSLNH